MPFALAAGKSKLTQQIFQKINMEELISQIETWKAEILHN